MNLQEHGDFGRCNIGRLDQACVIFEKNVNFIGFKKKNYDFGNGLK